VVWAVALAAVEGVAAVAAARAAVEAVAEVAAAAEVVAVLADVARLAAAGHSTGSLPHSAIDGATYSRRIPGLSLSRSTTPRSMPHRTL
jgi:hypothetical protein